MSDTNDEQFEAVGVGILLLLIASLLVVCFFMNRQLNEQQAQLQATKNDLNQCVAEKLAEANNTCHCQMDPP